MDQSHPKPEKVWNIITIGDGMVGKTCLLHRYMDASFDMTYVPTIFDMKEFFIMVSGAQHLVKLYDTAGQEEYDQLRQTFYKDADCFLVCFSVDNRTSYNNVIPFWMKELAALVKHTPIVLCATQIDKRRTNPQCVTEAEGQELSRKIGAANYVECSAKTNAGVPDAIHTAVSTAVYSRKEPTPSKRETKQTMPTQGVETEIDTKKKCIFCCF